MPTKKENPLKGAFHDPPPGAPPLADPVDGKKPAEPGKVTLDPIGYCL